MQRGADDGLRTPSSTRADAVASSFAGSKRADAGQLVSLAIASKMEHRKVIEVLNMSQQYMATDSIGTATISDTFVTPILNVCDILLAPF